MTKTATIEVHINGKDREVSSDLSISDLLLGFDLKPSLVVVEHNGEILERELYDKTNVREGDVLELVHFVGGG